MPGYPGASVGVFPPVERALRARVRPPALRRRARRLPRGAHSVVALAGQAAARALERGGRAGRRGDFHPARGQRAAAQSALPHDRVGRRVRRATARESSCSTRCRSRARRRSRRWRSGRTRRWCGCWRGTAARSMAWRRPPIDFETKSPRSRPATRPRRRTCSFWARPPDSGRASSFDPPRRPLADRAGRRGRWGLRGEVVHGGADAVRGAARLRRGRRARRRCAQSMCMRGNAFDGRDRARLERFAATWLGRRSRRSGCRCIATAA